MKNVEGKVYRPVNDLVRWSVGVSVSRSVNWSVNGSVHNLVRGSVYHGVNLKL